MVKCRYLVTSSLLSAVFCSVWINAAWADSTRHGNSGAKGTAVEEVQAPTPAQAAAASATPEIVGLVKSYEGNNLQMRLSDGTNQTYQVSPTVTGATDVRSGSFVSLGMDEKGQVKTLEMAEVDKVYDGTISKIADDQVTMDLADGTTYTTTIAPATATRMGLKSGSPLKVTTYKGTAATRICMGQATPVAAPPPVAPTPVAPAPAPEPVGGGELEPTPALPPQPRALW